MQVGNERNIPLSRTDVNLCPATGESSACRNARYLERLLANSPDAIISTDAEGRVVLFNEGAEQLLGYDAGSILGKPADILYPSTEAARAVMREMRNSGSGQVRSFEVELRHRSGERIPVMISASLLRDESGRAMGTVGYSKDLRPWIRAEREHRLLAVAIEQSDETIVITDREGVIQYTNPAFEKITGYSPGEAVGKTPRILWSGLHPPDFYREMWKTLAAGRVWKGDFVNRKKDGTLIEEEATISPVRGHDGSITHFVAVKRDVTAERRMEKRLRETYREMEALIGSLSSILITLDADFRVTLWNSTAEKVLGLRAGEVRGQFLRELDLSWEWTRMAEDLAKCRDTGTTFRLPDIRFEKTDGEKRFLGLGLTPIFSDDRSEFRGIILSGSDITEKLAARAQAAQSQKLEAIGQLAAGIAHEINTPMQFVGDNAQFLKESFEALASALSACRGLIAAAREGRSRPEEAARVEEEFARLDLDYLLEEIPNAIGQSQEGIARVVRIVRAMKEFSHPGVTEKTMVDLNHAIESTVTVARNEWKYVADVELHLDPSLPPVPCIPGEINQAILNIVVNAAHAIGQAKEERGDGGKGLITVTTLLDGKEAEIRIGDTGCGIPESARPKIFEPFFTTKGVGKGTGQGLSIAYNAIVKRHGGSIRFETETGKGTTFFLRLPLAGRETGAEDPESVPKEEPVGDLGS
ncbi:MAG: hypothetical protein Kow00128_02130 [Deltaproteobacteria bacterium]